VWRVRERWEGKDRKAEGGLDLAAAELLVTPLSEVLFIISIYDVELAHLCRMSS